MMIQAYLPVIQISPHQAALLDAAIGYHQVFSGSLGDEPYRKEHSEIVNLLRLLQLHCEVITGEVTVSATINK